MDVPLTRFIDPIAGFNILFIVFFLILGVTVIFAMNINSNRKRDAITVLGCCLALSWSFVGMASFTSDTSILAKRLPASTWKPTSEDLNKSFTKAYPHAEKLKETSYTLYSGQATPLLVDGKPQQCYFIEDESKHVEKVSVHYELYCGEGIKIEATH